MAPNTAQVSHRREVGFTQNRSGEKGLLRRLARYCIMKIPTITDYLFVLNRDRKLLEMRFREKRKAFLLTLAIFILVSLSVLKFILG